MDTLDLIDDYAQDVPTRGLVAKLMEIINTLRIIDDAEPDVATLKLACIWADNLPPYGPDAGGQITAEKLKSFAAAVVSEAEEFDPQSATVGDSAVQWVDSQRALYQSAAPPAELGPIWESVRADILPDVNAALDSIGAPQMTASTSWVEVIATQPWGVVGALIVYPEICKALAG